MNCLLSQDLWPALRELASESARKSAAVSYITSDKFMKFEDGDLLVVDASDSAIVQGHTDALVLERAFKRGAELYSYPGLHAKLMVLNGHAVVGSANLSASSVDDLVEAALVTDQPSIVGMAISMIFKLAGECDLINKLFIKRIKSLKVTPRTGGGVARTRRGRTNTVDSFQARTWIVGIHTIDSGFPDEETDISRGLEIAEKVKTKLTSSVNWLRFTSPSRFRREATRGDNVIQVWNDAKEKTPSIVYKHSLILRRQEEPKCTRFYVEDPSDFEVTALPWGKFEQLRQRIGVTGRIGTTSARLLKDVQSDALFLLWGE